MTVPFKEVPAAIRVPLFYAELDGSAANTAQSVQRTLIIGQITAAGVGIPNQVAMSLGLSDATLIGGAGSVLQLMTFKYRESDSFGEVWYLPLADDPAALAATGTIGITAAATATGTVNLYIGGVKISQPILPTQTTGQIATALAASINGTPNMPVSASVAGSVITLTAINKGPTGNEIDTRLNYLGSRGGEALPKGLVVSIVQMTGGATAPNLSAAFANLAGLTFDFIVSPYADTASLNALGALLNDTTGRWAWSNQIYGHYFAVSRGTLGTLTTFGLTRNDSHGSIMGVWESPTPAWLWAAALAGAVAPSIRVDPALPLQTLVLRGVLAPPLQSRFQLTERNTLLFDGMSTYTVDDDATIRIENLITTYQKNAFNVADNSYLQVETLFTFMYVLRYLKSVITSKYGRVKLAANGTHLGPGTNVVTPNLIRAELIGAYRFLEEELGLVQNGDAFKAGLVVELNKQNPSRVDVLFPADLIKQLRVFALYFQFR